MHIDISLDGRDTLLELLLGGLIQFRLRGDVSLELVQARLELTKRPLVDGKARLDVTSSGLHVPLQLSEVTGAHREIDGGTYVVEALLELLLLLLRELRVDLDLGLDLLNLLPQSLQLPFLEVDPGLHSGVGSSDLLLGLFQGLLVKLHVRVERELKVLDLLLDALQVLAELARKLGKVRDDLDGKLTDCSLTGHPEPLNL